jgi:hypothetical protein
MKVPFWTIPRRWVLPQLIHVGILSYEGPLWTYAHRTFVDKEKTAGGAERRAARGAREVKGATGVVRRGQRRQSMRAMRSVWWQLWRCE